MTRYKIFGLLILAALLASPAMAHLHVNMTPDGTSEGSQLSITHYGDASFSIENTGSRLEFHQNGSIYTVTADTQVGTQYNSLVPGLEGLWRGQIANFSADNAPDLNNPAGRTESGTGLPVGFEILSVVNVNDPSDSPNVIWRMFRAPGGGPLALPNDFSGYEMLAGDSDGLTPVERSYLLTVGAHLHGSAANPDSGFWLFTDAAPGLYEITIQAWDVQGYFTASDPVTFQLHVIPEPTSVILLLTGGTALLLRSQPRR